MPGINLKNFKTAIDVWFEKWKTEHNSNTADNQKVKILAYEIKRNKDIKTNIDEQTIRRILKKETVPGCDKLTDICKALGCSADYLLGLSPASERDAKIDDLGITPEAYEGLCNLYGKNDGASTFFAFAMNTFFANVSKDFAADLFDLLYKSTIDPHYYETHSSLFTSGLGHSHDTPGLYIEVSKYTVSEDFKKTLEKFVESAKRDFTTIERQFIGRNAGEGKEPKEYYALPEQASIYGLHSFTKEEVEKKLDWLFHPSRYDVALSKLKGESPNAEENK